MSTSVSLIIRGRRTTRADSQEEIAEQQAEADSLNRRSGERFRIFKDVESDILADGSLDYPNEVLETFDFVVASVHGRFNMDRASQTERIICAVSKHGVAVEINANPWRLDLDWRWHDIALKLGCLMSINPDAHSTRELDLTHWGVEMARKGGVPKERVLNCLSRDQLAFYLEKRRDRRVKLVSLQDGKPRLRTPTSGVKKPAAPRKRLKATNH
jgi:DNA polymerase (family X)